MYIKRQGRGVPASIWQGDGGDTSVIMEMGRSPLSLSLSLYIYISYIYIYIYRIEM